MASEAYIQFFEKYKDAAIQEQIRYGIPASVTLAQMCLESNAGRSKLAKEGNNFFGIKAGSGWHGEVTYHDDDRPTEAFRSYGSAIESMEDHSRILLATRYQRYVANLSSDNYEGWARGIKAAGYATDPNYASSLVGMIRTYGLDSYDREAIQRAQQQGVAIGYAKGHPFSNTETTSTAHQECRVTLAPLQGSWCLPIDFSNLKKTGDFGEQRSGHRHQGLDISTNRQQLPVFATEDNGMVTAVGNQPTGAGNYIKVEYTRSDSSKYEVTYMHLSAVVVKEGQTVNAGEQLGVSGNSGRSTGPHLHIETAVLQNGLWQRFDPILYLAELEVRADKDTALIDNKGNNVLALAKSRMVVEANGDVDDYQNQQLLANLTGSDDQNKWLAYLMEQNGEQCSGQDVFTSLISSLFKNALTLLVSMKALDAADQAAQEKVIAGQDETRGQGSCIVERERETVDVAGVRSQAEMAYNIEMQDQQQSQGLRQA